MPGAVLANALIGVFLVPPNDTYVGASLIRQGVFSPEEFATWVPYLPPGGVVVDAGANIGAHTLQFAAAVGGSGLVWAIEPQRMLYYMLCGTLALNNLRHVHAKHAALGREKGTVKVPPLDYSAPNNFGGLELGHWEEGEAVPMLPLDALPFERLDFLKIDVEGAEPGVLLGAEQTITRCQPVISVEADREQNVPALLGWLRLHGYRAWWHRPPLGPLFPRVVSVNLLALPRSRSDLPLPEGHVEVAIE